MNLLLPNRRSLLIKIDKDNGRELCTIDGVTYCAVTVLPEQQEYIPYTVVTLTDGLKNTIKDHSHFIRQIDDKIQAKIAEQYSIQDELKLLRKGNRSDEFKAYNDYVEECIAWGKTEKAKFGL